MPSVSPFSVQVALLPAILTSLCPNAGISSCAVRISPQTEHLAPSVSPFSVQVADLPIILYSTCPMGLTSLPFSNFNPHTAHRLSPEKPPLVQVAFVSFNVSTFKCLHIG